MGSEHVCQGLPSPVVHISAVAIRCVVPLGAGPILSVVIVATGTRSASEALSVSERSVEDGLLLSSCLRCVNGLVGFRPTAPPALSSFRAPATCGAGVDGGVHHLVRGGDGGNQRRVDNVLGGGHVDTSLTDFCATVMVLPSLGVLLYFVFPEIGGELLCK